MVAEADPIPYHATGVLQGLESVPMNTSGPGARATTNAADFSLRHQPSPFQAHGETFPGKNALLRCKTAGSTPPCLDHENFAVFGPFALIGTAFYPVLVHQLAASPHASCLRSVTLTQLNFTSFAVINSR